MPEETKPDEGAASEEKLIAGKYKTQEDFEAGHISLESKLGEMGNENGTLKAENTFIKQQLEQSQKQPDPEGDTQPDFEADLAEIERQVDEGDLSTGQAMLKTAEITAKISEANTENRIQKQQEQNMVEASRGNFLDRNPDFEEVKNSGVLEPIKNDLPGFHDDVSAYYEYTAQQTKIANDAAIETAKAESFEAGKAEMANIADGAKDTSKVLQNPGGETAKEIGRENVPLSDLQRQESGLEALKKSREG